jgi:Carbohydrate binding domain
MRRFIFTSLAMLLPLVALADNAADTPNGVAATAAPAKDAKPKNLLKPTNDVESWQLELTEGGKGQMKVEDEAIVFKVTEVDGTNWHVQAYQTGIDLKNGKEYVIKFKLKAQDSPEILLLGLINQDDWHEIGLHEEIGSSNDFKQYEFTFTALNDIVPKNNRIGFVLGADKGTVSIKDLTLTEK